MVTHDSLIAFLATTRASEAKAFYSEVLGLKLVEDTAFALVFDANGTMLRIQKVQELRPARYTALGWKVADIVASILALEAAGITPERFPGMAQDEHGIWTSPDGHKVAWLTDPDGNMLSLTEFR